MTAYTSLLLGIALCAATAYSLRCFTCESQSSHATCMTATNCSSDATYCRTKYTFLGTFLSVVSITKTCSASCTAINIPVTLFTFSTTCCKTDLCNTSATIRSSYAVIVLALGSVLTILKSSVL